MDKTKFTASSLEINKARQTLKDAGFFVDNLWCIDDVKSKFNCTDDEAYDVLDDALTNDMTYEQIWSAIDIIGQSKSLTEINQD